jgi:hypothetical protein
MPLRTLRCRLPNRSFLDLIVTTRLTNCRRISGSVNLRQLKQTESGLSSVLLMAKQLSRSWVLSIGMVFSLVRVWISVLTDLFYDVVWSCFGSFVPKTSPHYIKKFSWDMEELNGLKNRATRAAKRMKKAIGGA